MKFPNNINCFCYCQNIWHLYFSLNLQCEQQQQQTAGTFGLRLEQDVRAIEIGNCQAGHRNARSRKMLFCFLQFAFLDIFFYILR
jgi:hypothetical protein